MTPNAPNISIISIPSGHFPGSLITKFNEALISRIQTGNTRELVEDSHVERACRSDKASPGIVDIGSRNSPISQDKSSPQSRSSLDLASSVLVSNNSMLSEPLTASITDSVSKADGIIAASLPQVDGQLKETEVNSGISPIARYLGEGDLQNESAMQSEAEVARLTRETAAGNQVNEVGRIPNANTLAANVIVQPIKLPDVRQSPSVSDYGSLLQACFGVRIAVFTHEQGFPLETEIDEYDAIATHFLLCVVESDGAYGGDGSGPERGGEHDLLDPPPKSTTAPCSPNSAITNLRNPELQKPVGTIRVLRLEPGDNNSLAKHPVDKEADADHATRSVGNMQNDSKSRSLIDNGHDGSLSPALGYSAPKSGLGNSNGTKDVYKLGRLAVLREYRKYRFGRALVLAVHEWVKQDAEKRGSTEVEIISHSQIPVKGFYAKLGYVEQEEEFEEDGAPHQLMVARIKLLQE